MSTNATQPRVVDGSTTARSPKREQQRGRATKQRLIEAAVHVFAEKGFDGAATREIARRADAAQAALTYHFESKEELWKAAANDIFGKYHERVHSRVEGLEGVDDRTVARLLTAEYVRFAAEHPELHRFMMQEAMSRTPRLEWLVEHHVRPNFSLIEERFGGDRAEAVGLNFKGPTELFYYVVVGAAATVFAHAPEFELLTGRQPNELLEEHVDGVLSLLFSDTQPAPREG